MRLAVFAPEPRGGHPEYVAKLLAGMRQAAPGAAIYWPVRADADPTRVAAINDARIRRDVAIPAMPRRDQVGTLRWLLSRADPTRRHDVAFVRWLWTRQRMDAVLIEEIQRFTLGLLVMAARRRAKRVVVHLHNVRRHDYRGSVLDRVDEWLTGIGLRAADLVTVHSAANARRVHELYGTSIAVEAIPHGVSYREARVKRETSDSGSRARVLFYGVNRPEKGLSVLVEALRFAPDVHLTIAGVTDAAYLKATEQLIENVPNARWINGFVNEEETDRLFAEADAVALPYTKFEAQSGVLHLAIEYAVPVVVADLGALGETTRDLAIGEVAPPSDPAAFALALARVLQPRENERYRSNAEAAVRTRAWDIVGQSYLRALGGGG